MCAEPPTIPVAGGSQLPRNLEARPQHQGRSAPLSTGQGPRGSPRRVPSSIPHYQAASGVCGMQGSAQPKERQALAVRAEGTGWGWGAGRVTQPVL